MYKGLIVAVSLILIGTAGYFFYQGGMTNLITSDINNKGPKVTGVSAVEVFSGIYECIEKNGCENTTRLILGQDTTLDIIAIVDGQEISLGQGTWGVGSNGALVLIIGTTPDSPPGSPKSMIANNVSIIKISGFSKKKGLFPGMTDPIFTRVKNETSESTVSN